MGVPAITPDPYASIAQPVQGQSDPYASIAKPVATPTQPGNIFTSGHPLDTLKANVEKVQQGAQPGDGLLMGALKNFGAGGADVIHSISRAVLHPIDTLKADAEQDKQELSKPFSEQAKDFVTSGRVLGMGGETLVSTAKGLVTKPARTLGQVGTGVLLGEVAGPAIEAAPTIVKTAVTGPLKGVSFTLDKAGRLLEFTGATTKAQKLMASRAIVDGMPGELLQRALKPSVTHGADASTMLQETLPAVTSASPNIDSVAQFAKATDAAKEAQAAQYNARIAPYQDLPAGAQGPTPRPSAINGGPIADAQMSSIPTMDILERPPTFKGGPPAVSFPTPTGQFGKTITHSVSSPGSMSGGIVNDTARIADNYRQPLDVPTLDAVRMDANAKLNAFYNKTGGDQAAALSNPETARVKAVGDTTRQLLYEKLAKDAGITPGDIAAEQQLYGKLSEVSDIANKRDAVFSRHDPISLAEKVATGHGGPISRATNFVAQKVLRSVTDSDALVGSAVDRFTNPDETPASPAPGVKGVISNTGTALRDAGKVIAPSNSAAWVTTGAAKLLQHGVSAAVIANLGNSERGKSLLMRASSLTPGSPMMDSLSKQIATLNTQ